MLHKRVGYGFGGYQAPFVPRAARSARRRGPIQKKVEDNQLCAFDLLATVAGKILLQGESSEKLLPENDLSNDQDVVMEEYGDQGNQMLEIEHCDQGSPRAASPCLTLELGLPCIDLDLNLKEVSGPLHDASSPPTSAITSSDCLGKDNPLTNIDLNDEKSDFCSHTGNLDGFVPGLLDSYVPPVEAYAGQHEGRGEILFCNGPDTHCSEGPDILDGKPPAVVSSDNVKLTLGDGHFSCGSQSPCRDNNVNLVSRDDDENSSECTQPTTIKTNRSPERIGDRRINKSSVSKHWRSASKARDRDLSDNELRCLCGTRRIGYKRQRSQRIYPFKKRKFFRYSSFSNTDGHVGIKGVYRSRDKATKATATDFGSVGHGVNGSSACVAGKSTTFSSKESHVKLRIKSFCVPELFIEMPETATIGSLKRMVMEAVTSLLGGGLRVGVLLQGKRIRDDNRTLLQTGIGHEDQMESLGFTLDPNPSNTVAPVCSQDNSFVLSTDVPQPVSRCPIAAPVIHQEASRISPELLETSVGNLIESDHDSAPSPADLSAEKGIVDSHALVAVPATNALSVVPAHHKSKRCDMGQRRIRRPFSVSEVESLVQAVEKLGTGRWRDVKLRAFDDVKHRTYVDLKDKWKTLVHTAKIAPQQRRGEPVPQVLLDRVLAAHSYWSQQQGKQLLKQPSEACLLL